MTTSHLRIKIKTLAAESRIIRHAELRARKRGRARNAAQKPSDKSYAELHQLWLHRMRVVRPEARAAQLALAFLRGRPNPEAPDSVKPPLALIAKNVRRFSEEYPANLGEQVSAWIKGEKMTAAGPAAEFAPEPAAGDPVDF